RLDSAISTATDRARCIGACDISPPRDAYRYRKEARTPSLIRNALRSLEIGRCLDAMLSPIATEL
ncbi:MAG: hypothetical protein LC808_28305, partial [Actinobacteria bacterium]|nr:hypothetical protein [Actinomycetota bacterium]